MNNSSTHCVTSMAEGSEGNWIFYTKNRLGLGLGVGSLFLDPTLAQSPTSLAKKIFKKWCYAHISYWTRT